MNIQLFNFDVKHFNKITKKNRNPKLLQRIRIRSYLQSTKYYIEDVDCVISLNNHFKPISVQPDAVINVVGLRILFLFFVGEKKIIVKISLTRLRRVDNFLYKLKARQNGHCS